MTGAACRRRSIALLLALLAAPAAADSFREEFEQPGGGPLGTTRFSELVLSINGGVSRGPTDAGQGAPATGGVLPVDEGGDLEVRFYEVLPAASSSYALTPEGTFVDVEIDGYVGIGFTDAFGVRSAALLVRATPSPLNAYGVMLTHSLGDAATLALIRITDNVISNFATSDPFPAAPASENYRLVLRAIGDTLTASVLRVEAVGGERVETPIDLDAVTAGVQSELTATDSALTAGALGMRVFTRSTNSVFLDDVTVVDLVFLDGFESGTTSGWSSSVP
jgi:hypothetical protein